MATDIFSGIDALLSAADQMQPAPAPCVLDDLAGPDPNPVPCLLEDHAGGGVVASPAMVAVDMSRGAVQTFDALPAVPVDRMELARVYYRHHFGCRQCIAAGRNSTMARCLTGQPLWDEYLRTFGASCG